MAIVHGLAGSEPTFDQTSLQAPHAFRWQGASSQAASAPGRQIDAIILRWAVIIGCTGFWYGALHLAGVC